MKRLDLILIGKGGVGKSFFAVNFVQFLKDKGIAHFAIDSDNENLTLKRFHPDTRFLNLDNRRELDGIFIALEKANLVVMDCRHAGTLDLGCIQRSILKMADCGPVTSKEPQRAAGGES